MVTPTPSDTRRLVDPELQPMLDVFVPLALSPETLEAAREGMNAPVEGAPDPAEVYPDVTVTERHVPGIGDDPQVRVLHYEPKQRAASGAALVWIHGGGYVIGTADMDDMLCRRIATETGAVVASVDYRLAPETVSPGLVHDCYAALAWLHGNATELGVDATNISVGGASAGGGLAATLAILARDKGEIPVAAQFLIYPMLDDRTSSVVDTHPYAGEFVWTPSDNVYGWTAIIGGEPGGAGVSPYTAAARVETVAGLPPAFLSVGTLDLFVEEDIAYATRLLAEGIATELHVYPGAFHGYNQMETARVAQAYYRDFLGALDRQVNG